MKEKQQKALEYINNLDNTMKELYLKLLNGPIEEMGVNHIKMKCDLLGFDIEQSIDIEKIIETESNNDYIKNEEDEFIGKINKKNSVLSNLWITLIKLGKEQPSAFLPSDSNIEDFIKFHSTKNLYRRGILNEDVFRKNLNKYFIGSIPSLYEFYKHEILKVFDRTTTRMFI